MASKYYYGAILAATLASTTNAAEEYSPLEEAQRADRELGGWKKQPNWGHDGWGHNNGWGSSSSSSSSGKSGKSAGGGGKSGKSGGSSSSSISSSSSDDHNNGWSHGHGGWGKPHHGGWSSSSSSSSGKSGKSGGGKSGKSGGGSSSSSSSSHDGPGGGWYSDWGGVGWSSSSSSSSSGKSGKSGGGKSGKSGGGSSSSSSSSSYDGPGHWGGPGPWGGKPGKWGPHGGWSSSSSSSSSGKSGKSGGGKSGKSDDSSSSSSSGDGNWHGNQWDNVGGHWSWVGPSHGWDTDGWSSSSSGKSGKSGGSGSGKSGKSGGTSSSSGSESIDYGKWSDDGYSYDDDDDADQWIAPPEIYSKGGSLGGWKADGWDNDGHYKADIDYVRAHVRQLIEDSERQLIPKFLRLGFHDCVGGCDGCVDLDNADNTGLKEPIDAIYPLVQKFKDSYTRADIWTLATLVSADMAVLKDRPYGLDFPMRYIGRKDCSGASPWGEGGPDVEMPSNHLTTHGLLDFFKKYFDFDEDETVTIMGVHAVAVAHRENVGFGNKGKRDGWVFDADSYELDNRYYGMLVGENDWHLELVHNDNGIPDRYQWYLEKDGKEERPIMTNADMALVRDFSDHMYDDNDGNEGAVSCQYVDDKSYAEGSKESPYTRGRALQYEEESNKSAPACPVASDTMGKMIEYKMDNELWLYDFQKVLEKMLKNGY